MKQDAKVQSEAPDNMRIWSQVDTTLASDTKHVDMRGGFTAIDAYSQFHKATQIFGPCGIGWGWHTPSFHIINADKNPLLVCEVTLWYKDGEATGNVPVADAVQMKGGKTDEDAYKKALTSALTKALSYMGFNFDIFSNKGPLGFADNKYIEGEEAGQKPSTPPAKQKPAPSTKKESPASKALADAKRAVAKVYETYGVPRDEALKYLEINYDQPVREFGAKRMKESVRVLEQILVDKGLNPVGDKPDNDDMGGL